jgi:hypothetical protein
MTHDLQTGTTPDPFNPAALRLDPSYAETMGVRRLVTTIPVRKPTRHDFVRVNPDPEYRLSPAAIIELKGENETYLISPSIARELPNEIAPASLFTTINRQGVLSLWPVKLPGQDGKDNEWYRSAREAAEKATSAWVRVTANKSLGAYELAVATGDLPEPEWPEIAFSEILRIAFRDYYVDSLDHPLIKRLRGQV